MKKVGIICEYNPFHNGHIYHLKKVKELFPDSYIVLALAGNFTQRADPSIINKWDKTKIALDYNIDLVVELPYNISTSSADIYAKGAIDILNKLKCDYLVFGSETNNVDLLYELVNITKNNKDYQNKIKFYLKEGYNYPKSCSLALKDISGKVIDKPNDVLALEYVRSIVNSNSIIKPISIKRTNDYLDESINKNITSATSIRKNLNKKRIIKKTLPKESLKLINDIKLDDLYSYLKYQIMVNNNLDSILDMDNGIKNKLIKEINNCSNINDLILKVKSKRYSYNRIKRIILHIITNTEKDYNTNINYIRVLGLNNNGKKVLKEVKKYINVPIITKFKKEYECLFYDDIKASKIYSLASNYDVNLDYKSSIQKNN